jgi:Ser/Thr protein kinase RdoA (MazF antagonist)
MIIIQLATSGGDPNRVLVQVIAGGGEQLVRCEGPREVVLAALIEYLRGTSLRRIGNPA